MFYLESLIQNSLYITKFILFELVQLVIIVIVGIMIILLPLIAKAANLLGIPSNQNVAIVTEFSNKDPSELDFVNWLFSDKN